jgi:hypothetical protein
MTAEKIIAWYCEATRRWTILTGMNPAYILELPAAGLSVARSLRAVWKGRALISFDWRSAPSQDLALIASGGVRVEGLGVQEAAQLLRLLAWSASRAESACSRTRAR